jgi:iron complex outermembrane receptor protein
MTHTYFSPAWWTLILCFSFQNPAGAQAFSRDEIIVTATKRAQRSQDVPISLSVFTAETLESLRPEGLEDLSHFVPNMYQPPSTEAGQSFIAIRGIGAGIARSSGRSVGVYIDGVYINADTAMDVAMADIEHVEILKGPQGTLFGRDTLAGAINITTKRPRNENSARAQIDVGNFGYRQFIGSANLVLAPEKLNLNLSVLKRDSDGYIKNAFTGNKAEAQDRFALSAVFDFRPTDRLTARVSYQYQDRDDRPNTMGEAVTNIGSDLIPYTINLDTDERQTQSVHRVALDTQYESSNGFTFSSVTGWSHVQDFYLQDGDRLPDAITLNQFDGEAEEFSQEFRVNSPGGKKLNYLLGLYYLDSENLFSPTFPLMSTAFLERVFFLPRDQHPPDQLDGQVIVTRAQSLAAFAHADYHLTDTLSVFGGVRWTRDTKTVDYRIFGETFALFGLSPLQTTSKTKDTPISWTLGARYTLSDNIKSYASISRGYRSASVKDDFVGQADLAAPSGFFTKPEFVTNYEVGVKLRAWDGRVQSNFAAFYMDYSDIQVAVSQEPFLFLRTLTNAARAHISGFEADTTVAVDDHLTLSGTAGYLKTRYDQFIPSPGRDLAGTGFGTAPEWSFSAAADYARSFGSAGEWRAHMDVRYAVAPDDFELSTLAFVGEYALANGWVSYAPQEGAWRIKLWVENLTDVNKPEVNFLWGAGLGPLIENETARYQSPRRYGLTLDYRF